ncbi:MAG: Amuc_1099 family pilus-like system protein [Verrucomicrobiia bacterium]
MNWAKKNIEWTLLFGVLLILLGVAIFKALSFTTAPPEAVAEVLGGNAKVREDLDQYQDLGKALDQNEEWKAAENGHRLFISRKLEWLADERKLKLYRPDEAGVDGIAPLWKEKYGFSLSDPTVADQDPDKDGFTNKDEYLGKTDPLNAESHPPYTTKLRLTNFEAKPYSLEFTGVNEVGGQTFFQVKLSNPRDRRNRSNSVKKGDKFEDWRVEEYREKKGERENPKMQGVMLPYDESELDVVNEVTGEHLVLVMKQKVDAPILTGTLVDLLENKTYPVEKAQEITFRGVKYRVKNLSETGAEILALAEDGTEKEILQIPSQ